MKELLKRLGIISLFAIAMAWVESAVVTYLRVMIGRVDPYQANPLPISAGLGWIEVGREAATMVMLLTAGWLAGQTWRGRLGYSLLAFGTWDIFYYIFLVPMSGWPQSLLDWDVLFLIPLPWWGPVLSPALIALLMIIAGVLLALGEQTRKPAWPGRRAWAATFAGVALALYAFMETALRAVAGGEEAIRRSLPVAFDWPLFGLALALLSVPIADMARQLSRRN